MYINSEMDGMVKQINMSNFSDFINSLFAYPHMPVYMIAYRL